MSTAIPRSSSPKGAGLDQQDEIRTPDRGDDGAGPGGRVEDRGDTFLHSGLHRADKGRRHRGADVKPALDQRNSVGANLSDDADAMPCFPDGLPRADFRASTASVAHVQGHTRQAPNETMAWKRQNAPHSPQASQSVSSTSGTGMVISSSSQPVPLRNKWALGSSTSQSRSYTSASKTLARFNDTVAFPTCPWSHGDDHIQCPLTSAESDSTSFSARNSPSASFTVEADEVKILILAAEKTLYALGPQCPVTRHGLPPGRWSSPPGSPLPGKRSCSAGCRSPKKLLSLGRR